MDVNDIRGEERHAAHRTRAHQAVAARPCLVAEGRSGAPTECWRGDVASRAVPGGAGPVIPHRRSSVEVFILVAVAGLVLGLPLLSAAAAFLLILGLAADGMARRSHAVVQVTHRLSRTGVAIDDDVEVWLTVENPAPWPLPTVHFEDVVPDGADVAAPVPRGYQRVFRETRVWDAFHIGPHERVRHHLRLTARLRGRWVIGPARVWSRDPLGWSLFERQTEDQPVLTVYPRLYRVPPGILTTTHPEGDRRGPPWHPPDPLRVVGVRPYEPGDPVRLIHPYATARTGTLQVKRLEPEGSDQVELLVLASTTRHPGQGTAPDLFEALVSAAASVAHLYIRRGTSVGCAVVGAVHRWPQGVALPPGRGADQWARVMTALAWVTPSGDRTLDLLPSLGGLVRRLRPGAHLVYAACFHRAEWDVPLRILAQRGVRITYIPVGPYGGAPAVAGVQVRPWTPGVLKR